MRFLFEIVMTLAFLPSIYASYHYTLKCHAISSVVTDTWCNENCNLNPPNCPASMCICDTPPPAPTPVPPPTPRPKGSTWAVLAAGSSTYWNYRHQADVCHAYQILIKHGVDPNHIIVMMYDDVAHDSANPFPGKLFNQPKGPDVYGGCQIDYKGDVLSPSLFMHVLLGEEEAVKNVAGSGKVLKSGPNDRVFINFADHGGTGMIMFPGGAIAASDLLATLTKMHTKKMYSQLVFYLDTCESGSMFDQLPTDIDILAITSATPGQPANAIWCYSPDNVIQGKSIGSCLGDVMSVGWMMDSDNFFDEPIQDQVHKVAKFCAVNRCNPIPCVSHLCQYGDLSIEDEPVGWFQGDQHSKNTYLTGVRVGTSSINARDVKLELLQRAWLRAPSDTNTSLWKELQHEKTHRKNTDRFFTALATAVCGSNYNFTSMITRHPAGDDVCKGKMTDLICHKELLQAIDSAEICPVMQWGDYSAKYAGLLANFCDEREYLGTTTEELIEKIRLVCLEASES